ncbi:MAG: putative transposase [Bryobacterales bacterium]|nr:putative transposase [Bryobacterales bacterium]
MGSFASRLPSSGSRSQRGVPWQVCGWPEATVPAPRTQLPWLSSILTERKSFRSFLRLLFRKNWIVYAKPPFGGPEHVLHYLARYTHRVAISNHRLVAFENDRVTLRWKDYASGSKQRKMTLPSAEFLRRFLVHVLPRGFVRIRSFGFLANRRRREMIGLCRRLLGDTPPSPRTASDSDAKAFWSCPRCGGPMALLEKLTSQQIRFLPRGAESLIDSS